MGPESGLTMTNAFTLCHRARFADTSKRSCRCERRVAPPWEGSDRQLASAALLAAAQLTMLFHSVALRVGSGEIIPDHVRSVVFWLCVYRF
jgi:hypothetical protein